MEGEIDFSSYRPMNIGSFTNDRSKRNPLEQFKIIFLSTVKTIDAELRDTVISPFFETVKKFPFLLKYNPRTLAAAYVLSISEPSDISKNLTDLATILINYSKSRAPIPKVSKKNLLVKNPVLPPDPTILLQNLLNLAKNLVVRPIIWMKLLVLKLIFYAIIVF